MSSTTPQLAVLENASSLLDSALALDGLGKRLHAAHLAAICLEECTKCLMLFESVAVVHGKRAQSSHVAKGELIGVFHFAAGMLSVVYAMGEVIKHDLLQMPPEAQLLLTQHMMQSSGASGPDALASMVDKYLELAQGKPTGPRGKQANNEIRKNSVYCDIIEGLPRRPSDSVSEDQATDTIDDARLAVALLKMAMEDQFDWQRFLEVFPHRFERPEVGAKRFVENLKSSLGKAERATSQS